MNDTYINLTMLTNLKDTCRDVMFQYTCEDMNYFAFCLINIISVLAIMRFIKVKNYQMVKYGLLFLIYTNTLYAFIEFALRFGVIG